MSRRHAITFGITDVTPAERSSGASWAAPLAAPMSKAAAISGTRIGAMIPRGVADTLLGCMPRLARIALALTLFVAWMNFVLTTKWAAIDGALNGAKRPWYGAALAAATILAI